MVKIDSPNEEMFVEAFVKGLFVNPFSESLLWIMETIAEVHRRATTHIEAEEVMKKSQAEERCPLIKCSYHLGEGNPRNDRG